MNKKLIFRTFLAKNTEKSFISIKTVTFETKQGLLTKAQYPFFLFFKIL